MNYGLLSRNDDGDVVIDSAYRNVEIVQSGMVGSTSRGDWAYVYRINYSFPHRPMIFLRMRFGRIIITGRFTNTFCYFISDTGEPLEFFTAMPRRDAALAGSHGMAVYDAQGRVVYDSNRRYARLLHGTTFTLAEDIMDRPNGQSITHPPVAESDYVMITPTGWGGGYCNRGYLRYFARASATVLRHSVAPITTDASYPSDFKTALGLPYIDLGAGAGYRQVRTATALFARSPV